MKSKFTIDEQIDHMKAQGIRFSLYTEEQAKDFLQNLNYYFKVKAFAKNYKKINGQYVNLDFAYLRKFSILDTLFRDLILELSLSCEHFLKTRICYQCSINHDDDGYDIVNNFLSSDIDNLPKNLQRYDKNKTNVYSKDLIRKYRNDMPVWVFVEILDFGELIKFYDFYFKNFKIPEPIEKFYLYSIKSLRNIAAHNSCILHTLTMYPSKSKVFKPSFKLAEFLREKKLLSRRGSEIKIPMIHDFICLILAFNTLCPNTKMREKMINKIEVFFQKCEKHKEYFCHNSLIARRYFFIKKVTKSILSES